MSESRVRIFVGGGLVVVAVGFFAVRLLYPFPFASVDGPGWLMHRILPHLRREVSGWSLATMAIFPFAVLAIVILERLFPAVPSQKTLSTGLVHDGIMVLIEAAVSVVLFGWYSKFLYSAYTRHLGFLTLPVPQSLPVVVRWRLARQPWISLDGARTGFTIT